MILHITRIALFVVLESFELREDLFVRFAQDIRQHIEAPAVGHPDHKFPDTKIGTRTDDRVERRDERFTSFE